jgi:hypothetical protein
MCSQCNQEGHIERYWTKKRKASVSSVQSYHRSIEAKYIPDEEDFNIQGWISFNRVTGLDIESALPPIPVLSPQAYIANNKCSNDDELKSYPTQEILEMPFIVDTGCINYHIINDPDAFEKNSRRELKTSTVESYSGEVLSAQAIGTIPFAGKSLLMKQAKMSLLSAISIHLKHDTTGRDDGHTYEIVKTEGHSTSNERETVILTAYHKDDYGYVCTLKDLINDGVIGPSIKAAFVSRRHFPCNAKTKATSTDG